MEPVAELVRRQAKTGTGTPMGRGRMSITQEARPDGNCRATVPPGAADVAQGGTIDDGNLLFTDFVLELPPVLRLPVRIDGVRRDFDGGNRTSSKSVRTE